MIRLKKINDEVVKPVQVGSGIDPSKIKAPDLFDELYCNIFICAKKKSGKTQVIFKILKNKVGKNTRVFFFVSTLYKDPLYIMMREYLDKKGIQWEGFTALNEEKVDVLKEVLDQNLQPPEEEDNEVEEIKESKNSLSCLSINDDINEIKKNKKKKKSKKDKLLAPEIIFIFDDLSRQLRSPSVVSLLKMNRHMKSMVLLSSQYPNDLQPESIQQCDYILLFKGHPQEKLKKLWTDADLSIDEKRFLDLYHHATAEKYSFLYVDTRNESFRKGFNKEYKIDQE